MTPELFAWLLIVGAVAATYAWRGLGVALSAYINPDGALFQWVSCVSYAMLAGLVSRMTVMPLGELALVPLPFRLAALASAFAVFFLTGRRVLPGVLVGFATFVALVALASPAPAG